MLFHLISLLTRLVITVALHYVYRTCSPVPIKTKRINIVWLFIVQRRLFSSNFCVKMHYLSNVLFNQQATNSSEKRFNTVRYVRTNTKQEGFDKTR